MKNLLVSQLRVAQNIKLLRIHKGLSQEELGDILGLTGSRYPHYEQGIRAIPIDTLSAISSFFNIAIDALVKSDLSKVDLNGLIKVGENRLLFPIIIRDNEKIESIEVVPVKASAGYLRGYSDPTFIEGLPRMNLPFFTKGTYRAFPIVGDSMIPIKDGSIVVGQFIEKLNYIKEGKTYILVTTEGISFKRVYWDKNDKSVLILSSDNKAYTNYSIPLDTILEVWEFAGFISLKGYDANEYSFDTLFPLVNGISSNMERMSLEIAKIKQSLNVH
jgi:transcriptional regulator with XRE-family HTH domain